jgi:hypothetical protein
VAAFTYPIAWLLETLRQWRSRERQQAPDNLDQHGLDDSAMTADVCRGLNTPFLLPPM